MGQTRDKLGQNWDKLGTTWDNAARQIDEEDQEVHWTIVAFNKDLVDYEQHSTATRASTIRVDSKAPTSGRLRDGAASARRCSRSSRQDAPPSVAVACHPKALDP
jgi:hypothetical protein